MSTATGLACAAQCRLISERQRYEQCMPGHGSISKAQVVTSFHEHSCGRPIAPLPLVTSESLGPRRAMRRGLLGLLLVAVTRARQGTTTAQSTSELPRCSSASNRLGAGQLLEPTLAGRGAGRSRTCGRTSGQTGLDLWRTGTGTGLDDGARGKGRPVDGS